MITWEQLTAGEQSALSRWINIDREFVNEFEKGLQAKGLIRIVRIDHHRHQNMLTDAGRAVLAQAQAGQPEAEGEADLRVIKRLKELRHEYHYGNLTDYGKDNLIALAGEMLLRGDTSLQSLIDMQAALAASLEREKALRAALAYYANPTLYVAKVTTYKTGDLDVDCELLYEGGKRATEALAALAATAGKGDSGASNGRY